MHELGVENMFDVDHFIGERQPKRAKWNSFVSGFASLGIFFTITMVGIVIAPIFFLIAAMIAWVRNSRYPVIKMTCLHCDRKLKVEPEVTKFTCPYCCITLRKNGDVWKKGDVDWIE
ncbi:hypothetical protein [Geobacillus sp. 47C-IIb]|jgi:predicted RNA-binding Zn-ribbon protein involved in translation (DUF1610 family)|nr:hypothetical protein [Geobacillus sp. 47C-IIb]ATO36218.1 hypothetical protein GTID1_02700 [Geobacillus thermodenitrificans]QNU31077.1 hypothetical protein IC804_17135 [Geobacillus sp. 47C-IIb]